MCGLLRAPRTTRPTKAAHGLDARRSIHQFALPALPAGGLSGGHTAASASHVPILSLLALRYPCALQRAVPLGRSSETAPRREFHLTSLTAQCGAGGAGGGGPHPCEPQEGSRHSILRSSCRCHLPLTWWAVQNDSSACYDWAACDPVGPPPCAAPCLVFLPTSPAPRFFPRARLANTKHKNTKPSALLSRPSIWLASL